MKPTFYLIVVQLLVMMVILAAAFTGHQDLLDQLRTALT